MAVTKISDMVDLSLWRDADNFERGDIRKAAEQWWADVGRNRSSWEKSFDDGSKVKFSRFSIPTKPRLDWRRDGVRKTIAREFLFQITRDHREDVEMLNIALPIWYDEQYARVVFKEYSTFTAIQNLGWKLKDIDRKDPDCDFDPLKYHCCILIRRIIHSMGLPYVPRRSWWES